jgi:hypothetical protein
MAKSGLNACSIPALRAAVLLAPMVAAISLWLASGHANAGVVLAEDFNRADGTNMNGATPDVANLPGGVFTQENNGSITTVGGELQIGPDVSLEGYLGGYNSGVLQVSADVSTGNTQGPDSQKNRGVGLGFNAQATGAWNTFTGLRLTPLGDLLFEANGQILATVSVGTSLSGSNLGLLSYDVDFNTGAISDISLQGSSASFLSIVTASQAQNYFGADDYVSVFGGGSAGGQYAYVDNLSVSNATPVSEPASAALFGSGVGLLGLSRRRRNRAA